MILLESPLTVTEVPVTKSATWKLHRDLRKQVSESNETVDLRELDALIKDSPWQRGWVDLHDGAQVGIIYLIRPDLDECAVVEWPVYGGWGDKATPIPRTALDEARRLLDTPPSPRLRTVEDLEGCIRREERTLELLRENPQTGNTRIQAAIDECEKLIEEYRALIEERK